MAEVLRPGSIGGLKTHKASDEDDYPKILLYGPPGVGKTTLAGSASELESWSPVLSLNIENGALSLKHTYPDVEVADVNTTGQLQRAFNDLYRGKHPYRTVILDNCTEGQKQGIEYIFDGDKQSTDFIEFADASWKSGSWNRSSEQMRKMIRYFRGLPMNIIFVAWAKDHAKEENKVRMGPSFSKTFAQEAPGMVPNTFYYYFNKDDERTLLCSGNARAVAQNKEGRLPQTIKDPTMAKIVSYWGEDGNVRRMARSK